MSVFRTSPDPIIFGLPCWFEMRTAKRCKAVQVETHADHDYKVRRYELPLYFDSLNDVSHLVAVRVIGFDELGNHSEELPPLEFGYSDFNPRDQKRRDLYPVQGADLPAFSLANPALELVDLFGNGLPDILEMNGTVRYWRNLGRGRFDIPRLMRDAPAGLALADAGVQLIDANGDGRADLLVTQPGLSGYFPLQFGAKWDRHSMRKYESAPSFSLKDPEVRLIDLTGDGVTDAIRSGTRLECFFNDPERGWLPHNTNWVERKALENFPNVNFSDPRVKWGDLSGDGLQDLALVYDGNVEYWPNLGYGTWGRRLHMRNSPRFPFGCDPKRILLGDIDGDGLADIVYVDDRKIRLWINQSGNAWSDEIVIQGTPPMSDMDAVRLTDLLGSGIAGILWTRDASQSRRDHYFFLDLTGGVKPYLLREMNNNMGALTKVGYAPSTRFYLKDEKNRNARWRTPLPFPVQVVAQVEVIDQLSQGKLTTEYQYHHGYWDGAEREFRGFGMVEQLDTEPFDEYHKPGLHGSDGLFNEIDRKYFSAPTLTKTWFHQGPVEAEVGDWREVDYSSEYWQGDPPLLDHKTTTDAVLYSVAGATTSLARRAKRDALRVLRGSVLRTELYALDGSAPERESRPYTVTESAYGLVEIAPPLSGDLSRTRIFFPHPAVQRTTQWERGNDPMTQFSFTGYEYLNADTGQRTFDEFGRPRSQTAIAMPRRSAKRTSLPGALPGQAILDETMILATHTRTEYAAPSSQDVFIHDRASQSLSYELTQSTIVNETKPNSVQVVLQDQFDAAKGVQARFDSLQPAAVHLIAHAINHYDGAPFIGLDIGKIGQHGALTRSEALVMTDAEIDAAYETRRPVYLGGAAPTATGAPPAFGTAIGYRSTATPSGVTGYYSNSSSRALDNRGLPIAQRDPLGHEATVVYDRFQWLPVQVTDPVGNTTAAEYNYRVLQPQLVTDANGNQTRFSFSALGMPNEIRVWGNPAKDEGDRARPSARFEYDFLAFLKSSPHDRRPAFVRAIRRERHDTDATATAEELGKTIETHEYSDGFGRLLQTRTQGEALRFSHAAFGGGEDALPISQSKKSNNVVVGVRNSDAANPNVVVSGWQVYDNKGRVVEKFEPFFSTGWEYLAPGAAEMGQRVSMFYDPRGHVIRTINPDGSEQRVVFGIPTDLSDPSTFDPTPWEGYAYDANDLAPLSFDPTERQADGSPRSLSARADSSHHFTPVSTLVDGLGRTVAQIQRNGSAPASDWFVTRSRYDIRGNVLAIIDALGREAFLHRYDLLNRPLRVKSIDAGLRTSVLDAAGNLIEYRDDKGSIALRRYDPANRLMELWARNDASQALTQREHVEYIDLSNLQGLTVLQAADVNLIGRPGRHYDEAGVVQFARYDFKGNLLEKTRRVISDDALANNWVADWSAAGSENALDAPADGYTSSSAYDALNRVTALTYPADVTGKRARLLPRYNRAGALEAVMLDDASYVNNIAYNAKGQRVLIAYGNGIMTRYSYEPRTFRLARLRTEKYSTAPNTDTYAPNGGVLQDYAYRYDLAGNIVAIVDRAPKSGVRNNADQLRWRPIDPDLANLIASGNALARDFEYDPLYRLTSATGREGKSIPSPRPQSDYQPDGFYAGGAQTPNQDNAPDVTVTYAETYAYDPAGNMLTIKHSRARAPAWTRGFGMGFMAPDAWNQEWRNRLNAPNVWANPRGDQLTHVGDDLLSFPQTHRFDANGNLLQENTERYFAWDHADRLTGFLNRATPASIPTVDVRYLYGADRIRVKKWVRENGSSSSDESITCVDRAFEHHRWQKSRQTNQNNSLHVTDGRSRIALVRVGTVPRDDTEATVQHHLGDHLGSCTIVIGGATVTSHTFINREEYFPYGETSFGSFGRKRYRFTGNERDEECGLEYHEARYRAPWLVRWVSSDPGGMVDGSNLYICFRNSPLCFIDASGTQSSEVSTWDASDAEGLTITAGDTRGRSTDSLSVAPLVTQTTRPSMSYVKPEPYIYKYIAHPSQWRTYELEDTVSPGPESTVGQMRTEPQKALGHASHSELEKYGSSRTSWTTDARGARLRGGWNSDRLVKADVNAIKAGNGMVLDNPTLRAQVEVANLENISRGGKANNSRVTNAREFYTKLSETQVVGPTPKGAVVPMRVWEGRVPRIPAMSGSALLGYAWLAYGATQNSPDIYDYNTESADLEYTVGRFKADLGLGPEPTIPPHVQHQKDAKCENLLELLGRVYDAIVGSAY